MTATAPLVEVNRAGWLKARRHGVPASMVALATARRAAGDWRGACEAARYDVAVDLAAISSSHGRDIADQVEADLRHLVPDLARWHLPRQSRGGSGLLDPGKRITLARYGGGPTAPALWLGTPAHLERPQRVELRFGPLDPLDSHLDSWCDARHRWDARASDALQHWLGGGDRTPFFHRDGRPRSAADLPSSPPDDDPVALTEWVMLRQDEGRYEEAWRAAGIAADFAVPEAHTSRWLRQVPEERSAMVRALVSTLTSQEAGPREFALRHSWVDWRSYVVKVSIHDGQISAVQLPAGDVKDLPTAPRSWWERLPDLDLLRYGHLTATALHPLVRSALFPDEVDRDDFDPAPVPLEAEEVRVRCRGGWHRVAWHGGRIEPIDHSPAEAQRERVMRSLGGQVPRCFSVTETWRGTAKEPLPRVLRELRHHAMMALEHGDTDAFVRLLDLGIDPIGIRDRWRRGPLHLLARIDGERLLGRLLAANLDINEKDVKGRGPLGWVLYDGGSAGLVRAMIDAGADAAASDDTGDTGLHLIRSRDAATIVPWLLAAGLDLATTDTYGRAPLLTQVLSLAPVETIRATLGAGADPNVVEEYTDLTLDDTIDASGRDDLDFLRTATAR